ncbi:unnamed protein product [Boreogadus saida]
MTKIGLKLNGVLFKRLRLRLNQNFLPKLTLLQGIVNDEGRFIDIFVGPPGRVHDARMLRGSTFYANWQEKMEDYRLLGDSAYIGQAFPFIITPKRDNGALTDADHQQNFYISRGRVIVLLAG